MRRTGLPLMLALLAVLLAVPAPGAAASSAHVEAGRRTGPAAPRPFTMNLANRSDWVAQTNFVQCVGASMQMMQNMVRPDADRSAKTQLALQDLARSWSPPRPQGFERKGASVRGWAAGLNVVGVGPYTVVGEPSLGAALKTAARAIRITGRPVGLLVWRGRHAWVMSGFTATADPLQTSAFRVTGANIHDPLYPHGSSTWGRSPRPGELLGTDEVGRQFKPRRSSSAWTAVDPSPSLAGQYVLVLPYRVPPIVGSRLHTLIR